MTSTAGNSEKEIGLLIVDDHHIVRSGLTSLINSEPDMQVLAEANDGQKAIDLFRQLKPDVTLMDLRLPVVSGVEATIAIRKEFPEAKILVLTTYDGDEDIYRALQAGASGYLLKGMFAEELLEAIRAVNSGMRRIPPAIAERLAARLGVPELTAREVDVLGLIVKGNSNKEIAASLGISEATVKTHINNLLGKLGASDRTHAATIALQRGIIHM